jgi:hypothetical protein
MAPCRFLAPSLGGGRTALDGVLETAIAAHWDDVVERGVLLIPLDMEPYVSLLHPSIRPLLRLLLMCWGAP